MKKNINAKLLILFSVLSLSSCTDYIDLENKNEIAQDGFYRDAKELNLALQGAYATLRAPISDEWYLTEIRSDNSFMSTTGSTANDNLQIYNNDVYVTPLLSESVEDYWLNTYKSIRVINGLLVTGLKTSYDAGSGTIVYNSFSIPMGAGVRENIAGQASFMRAYHYFNLVRIYGEVFLLDDVVSPEGALDMRKSSVADIYKFIIADLNNAIANCSSVKYTTSSSYAPYSGLANKFAAEALLAKVYLTLGRKADAVPLLTDVIANSGNSLLKGAPTSYASVFAKGNEMNAEVIFTIRFKSSAGAYGSPLSNLFSSTDRNVSRQTGLIFPSGTCEGYNNPTEEFYKSFPPNDVRRDATMKVYKPTGTTEEDAGFDPLRWTYWSAKQNSESVTSNGMDSELDWHVLRFSDVLLMYCEAVGVANTTTLGYLNQVHTRAGLTALTDADVNTQAKYELAVANERRWEFGLENQRWFDLLRFEKTMTTLNGKDIMKSHFEKMYSFYAEYPNPFSLDVLKANVDDDKFLLSPIPLREIRTNTGYEIPQNSGY